MTVTSEAATISTTSISMSSPPSARVSVPEPDYSTLPQTSGCRVLLHSGPSMSTRPRIVSEPCTVPAISDWVLGIVTLCNTICSDTAQSFARTTVVYSMFPFGSSYTNYTKFVVISSNKFATKNDCSFIGRMNTIRL